MRISAADVKRLGQRREQPAVHSGDLLACFVRGKLVNPKNQNQAWQLKAWGRYKRQWREATANALLLVGWRREVPAEVPKLVTFRSFTHNAIDGDGLQLALAAVRDALITCGVVSDDADRAGHVFTYAPSEIQRASTHRGVEIRVRVLA
jgi:hypothetical protein